MLTATTITSSKRQKDSLITGVGNALSHIRMSDLNLENSSPGSATYKSSKRAYANNETYDVFIKFNLNGFSPKYTIYARNTRQGSRGELIEVPTTRSRYQLEQLQKALRSENYAASAGVRKEVQRFIAGKAAFDSYHFNGFLKQANEGAMYYFKKNVRIEVKTSTNGNPREIQATVHGRLRRVHNGTKPYNFELSVVTADNAKRTLAHSTHFEQGGGLWVSAEIGRNFEKHLRDSGRKR